MSADLRVALISLGCAKNQVDSEYILGDMERHGFRITDDLGTAEVVIVNTCGFIQPAKEESIETILETAVLRENGNLKVLAVTGCLSQRYGKELETELAEVDVFTGVGESRKGLPAAIMEKLGLKYVAPALDLPSKRQIDTAGNGWAYLKISEGCSNRCSYCAIPIIRGDLSSRPADEIVEEARYLESLGVQEINLIAQDVTAFGSDSDPGNYRGVVNLLESLLNKTKIPWFRLLYAHPAHTHAELLDLMAAEKRIVSYLDIPVQHASDRMLGLMRRGIDSDGLRSLVKLAREKVPDITLRTTALVGHPGETEEDFEKLVEFIEWARFDRLGAFAYSDEEDTAAVKMADKLDHSVRESRLEEVLEIQRGISSEKMAALVGRKIQVLVEGELDPDEAMADSYSYVGRSRAHAPEVDGWVYIEADRLDIGSFADILVEDSSDYDLFGRYLT